ncbi:hypothetical protein LEP1GSC120_0299 [Leptospira santarosai str. 200702252]|nr:hypothetical protein LEP1GSC068_3644 [Leptospira sp. Fiocruz LV3954]EMI66059.1 hypothetical protein LEP1GSC076_2830 [Leptospira sp. Fiocruz LV4135]EMO73166.1 hypothetical protein LEP1GSC130_2487 [Leptospira santarosai str. 200403458]EMO96600.1 hypothetical protein LEP1GSC120_0299 [Leptospira santarosai str. 200702252]
MKSGKYLFSKENYVYARKRYLNYRIFSVFGASGQADFFSWV